MTRQVIVILLRVVETIDFMAARWVHLPCELLEHASNRIINEVRGVSRVTYDISSKPPATSALITLGSQISYQ